MNQEIKVREIHEKDAQAFLDLLNRIDAETEYMLLESGERRTTVGEQRERIRSVLSNENQTILVADREGQLVGYLLALGGELERIRHRASVVIGVLRAFVGEKIGTRLFTELERWAGHHGITRLELTVRTDNDRGTALYRKVGFEVEGVRSRSLRVNRGYVDEYYMAKIIDLRT